MSSETRSSLDRPRRQSRHGLQRRRKRRLGDSIDWWDDFNHFLNWGILVTACGQFLVRFPLGRVNTAALMIGFGGVTAILWEFGEYFTFIRGGPEEKTAYTDTLGDLAGGLTGSTLAAPPAV